MIKNKNFLTRGLEAQAEREAALKEYQYDRIAQRAMEQVVAQNIDAMAKDFETFGVANQQKREEYLSNISVAAAQANAHKLTADISDIRNRHHIEAIEKQYRKSVRTSLNTRSTKEDIARHQYSTANYGAASNVAYGSSTSAIQEQIDAISQQRYDVQQAIIKDSQSLSSLNLSDDKKQELQSSLSTKWQSLESLAQKEGIAKAGIAIQKRKGLDTASMYENVSNIMSKYTKEQIIKDAQSGKAGSISEINKTFDDTLAKLIKSFGDLDEVLHRNVTTEEEIAKQKQDIAAAEEKLKNDKANYEKAEIQKEAASGGGGNGRWRTAAAVLGGMGSAAQASGGMFRQWAVGQEMDKMQFQTSYMDIANRRFFDRVSASQGDAAAIARIRGSQHESSSAIAKSLGGKEVGATAAEGIGQTLALGATAATYGALSTATGGASNILLGGQALSSMSGQVQQISGTAAKLESGAIRAQAELAAYNAKEGLFDAQNRMQAFVNQNALDYTRNTTLATRGAGRGRRALLAGTRDIGFMKDMSDREIDQAGILSLTQAGIGGLGNKFRGAEDIKRAGELTSAGLTSSPEEYLALRAAGEKGGVGAGGLETILRNAVAAGMDNSKNIQEMMQGISSIATVRGGVSTFGGAADNMALSVQSMMASGMSSEMAIKAAADLNKSMSDAASDRGVSVQNLVEVGELQRLLPNADMAEISNARLLTPEEIKTISRSIGTPNEAKTRANFGIPANWTREQIEGIGKTTARQSIGTFAGLGLNAADEQLFSDIASGKTILEPGSKEQLDYVTKLNQRARLSGKTAISADSVGAIPGLFDINARPREQGISSGIPGRDLGSDIISATARGQVTANAAGQKDLEGNVATMIQAAKDIRPEAFKEAISASSKELGGTLAALNTSIAALDSTVKALNGKLEPRLQTPNRNQLPNPYSGPKY